ncbi:cellulose biosynthesis protein BcsN [Methylobacterium sp. Gmos1]
MNTRLCIALLALVVGAGSALAQPAPALRLPGAGRVAAVIETRHRDGFDQRITYEGGDGRNHAEIALRNETGDLLLAFPPRLAKPSEFGIAGEIAVRFPGEVMRVQAVPRRNAYGPIGLALGADCLYAWQWFERPRRGAQMASRDGAFGTAEPGAGRRALSLRIRLCRTAQASLDDLVAAVQHLTIALPGDGAVRAVAAPRPVPRRRVAKPAPRPAPAPAPEARPAPPPERPQPQPRAEPVPPRPTVPVPPAEGGRRYLAPRTPEARPPEAPPPEAAPRSGSQRYITDGPQAPEPPGATPTPSPAPGRGAGETLSRDLPPEAYRPPPDRGPGR